VGTALTRRTVGDLKPEEVNGRRALVRVDFNVPLKGQGDNLRVASDARIRATLPTVTGLVQRGATVVLVTHLGRPGGERRAELSLAPVARCLEELLGRRIIFLSEPFDERALKLVRMGQPGDVFLLENLRFEAGETTNEPGFAAFLARFGQLFVQDAFGTCHRAHASTVGVAGHLSPRVAGQLVERELCAFHRLLEPERPFVAVLGGAKIAGKLEIVDELARRCDRVCLGGGMANTFLLATGAEVGDSLVEPDRLEAARQILDRYPDKVLLPSDAVVAADIDADAEREIVSADGVSPGRKILDIGPTSVRTIVGALKGARTVFWNGPLGVFETPPFDAGTLAVAKGLADVTGHGAYTVIGGGDSIAALERGGLMDGVSHVSTGGGAALKLVSGAILPGIEVLDSATRRSAA
jgi:phosphoglycerate kinase